MNKVFSRGICAKQAAQQQHVFGLVPSVPADGSLMQEVETFTRVAKLRELFPPALHLPNDLRDSRVAVLQGSGLSQSSFHFNEIDLIIHGEKSSNLNLGSLEPLQSDAILYRIWRGRASTSDVMRLSRVLTTFPLWLADIALRVCKSDVSDEDSLGDIVTLWKYKRTTTSKFSSISNLDVKISSRRSQEPPEGERSEIFINEVKVITRLWEIYVILFS